MHSHQEGKIMSTPETSAGPALQHIRLQDLPMESINPLLDRQLVTGERAMLARIILRAGCVVPLHSHDNEQITYVLEGALKFLIQDREIVVRAGEVLVIPSHMPHSAEALEDTVDLDIFCPPRADWIQGTDQYLRK
jgi:quercetin dioxygenase-like cupin family protein